MAQFDAILLSSFGGPEGQDDVLPFLRNVTTGRGIPDERLEEVAAHYRHFGGVSPINQQNRELKAALESELQRRQISLPVYWGNRNWAPYFNDVVREAEQAGHTRLLGLVTSAYTSYSGVGQYREDFIRATEGTGVSVFRIREYFDHPGFVEPLIEGTREAVKSLNAEGVASENIHVLYVTHSIPVKAAAESGSGFGEGGAYVAQHRAVSEVINAAAAPGVPWALVYQSRSGNPSTPWLEPDINDAIKEMAHDKSDGKPRGVVVVPIGFVSDHMEVLWDLDNEARATAAEAGFAFRRVLTPGVHPKFVSGLVDLIEERLCNIPISDRPHLTALGPWSDHAPVISGVFTNVVDEIFVTADTANAHTETVTA